MAWVWAWVWAWAWARLSEHCESHWRGNPRGRTYVKRLRRKLREDAGSPKYIFAEPRVGYRIPKGEQSSGEPPATE